MTETSNEAGGTGEPMPDRVKFVARTGPEDAWDPMQDVTTPQGKGAGVSAQGVTHSPAGRQGGARVRTTERQ